VVEFCYMLFFILFASQKLLTFVDEKIANDNAERYHDLIIHEFYYVSSKFYAGWLYRLRF
jgi:hypothetical protein